ncbi:P44/Msp2 family outer membrane protein [uncultured Desulfuromusa sp.]|uniref:P44/Msp2 family outer membrane protein n=1 Tax=uncultured Desulfuromusa sp. TaxID=219183 RepID=UPI002AA6239B|nr:P44/Msp2 family outer membrane protein [uncultured Desulfuromusa sp.]
MKGFKDDLSGFSTLVAVLVFLFSVQPSFAEFYVSGNIGMLFLPDRETTEIFPIEMGWYNSDANSVTGGSFTSTEEFDEGIRITGAIGTHIFDAVRGEFEAGYAKNHYRSTATWEWDFEDSGGYGDTNYAIDSYSALQLDGDLTSWTFMGNAFYDFQVSNKFKPYVGAGLGISIHKFLRGIYIRKVWSKGVALLWPVILLIW